MGKSFYWYDLETSGTEPRWDRVVQFAGMRTDAELNVVGDEFVTDVVLPDDVLPDPAAALVTGITPQRTTQGMPEWEAMQQIHDLFSVPNTCVVGYNSLRFDDEFIRFAFYRNFLDPYAREWRNGNSRWDLVDLVRAAGALRPEGLEWPTDEEGGAVYRLEALSQANQIEHGHAHDALSDVRATVGLAQKLKSAQPRLFDYYLTLRNKKNVRAVLEPFAMQPCVHVSGMYPKERLRTAIILPVCRHPINSNSVIAVDLGEDVSMLLEESETVLTENLFKRGAVDRPPLKEIRINRCPFVAELGVLTEDNLDRCQLDLGAVQKAAQKIRQPAVVQKISRMYAKPRNQTSEDVDAALYDGFLQDHDRSRSVEFTQALRTNEWRDMDFQDKRLRELAVRLKARCFPAWQSEVEAANWRAFVHDKLAAESEVPWRTLTQLETELSQLRETTPHSEVLDALDAHVVNLRSAYSA